MDRDRVIIRTSVIGIAVNVVLVLFKMAVGLLSNSIAIILDAVNNLSDALSSVITIIGTKLAGRAPDKRHPYGHGRIEYLTSVVISVIVLLAGVTSLRESAAKVLHPDETSYSAVSLVILAVAVGAKLLCGRYVRGVGARINAQSLVASGSDALFDAVLSLSTLAAALANLLWGFQLEGLLGVVISIFILKAGIETLSEPLNSIIGVRADHALSEKLLEKVRSYPQVRGAYDLTLHNYGPSEIIGSVHIEVNDEMRAREIHRLTRMISGAVYQEFGIILSIGIYAANDSSEVFAAMKREVERIVAQYPEILQMHGFYVDPEQACVMFDLIMDFQADMAAVRQRVLEEASREYPDYRFDVILDSDYSD